MALKETYQGKFVFLRYDRTGFDDSNQLRQYLAKYANNGVTEIVTDLTSLNSITPLEILALGNALDIIENKKVEKNLRVIVKPNSPIKNHIDSAKKLNVTIRGKINNTENRVRRDNFHLYEGMYEYCEAIGVSLQYEAKFGIKDSDKSIKDDFLIDIDFPEFDTARKYLKSIGAL